MCMPSIDEIIKNGLTHKFLSNSKEIEVTIKKEPKLSFRSERADVLSQIHTFYSISTKKENWKRYCKWLRENRIKPCSVNIEAFKKSGSFLKTRNSKSFAIMLAHIPTKDLYFILSVGKDKDKRNENFSGWLMGEVYKK